MLQDYITFLIIAVAFGTFIYRILSFFNLTGKKTVKSGNCAGCTSGCEIKHSLPMGNNKPKKRNQYQFYL
jgi:hypothetical protein